MRLSKVTRITRHNAALTIAAVLTVAAISTLTATPAQAGSEFDDSFEDQLGRLVAGEVFQLGKWVLTGGPHYGHHRYAEPVHYRGRHKRRHYRRHHKHHRVHREHYWRHHRGHDHRYGDACRYESRERVRRNRYGEVIEYERHERGHRDRYARY